MKKFLTVLIFTLAILLTLGLLLYPSVSSYVNSLSQSRAVAHYFDDIASVSNEEAQRMLAEAREYNGELLTKSGRFNPSEEETARYHELLDAGRGVMGVLMIDKINVKLPMYHGTDEGVLQVGLGHMQGTSLPVGGPSTHAFITGHRGLPSSTLLTELDKMVEGDRFILYVLGETMTYEVDNIVTVLPHDVKELNITPGADYCTLVTCTPYGINSHRLLVRGTRVDNDVSPQWETIYSGAKRLDKFLTLAVFMIPLTPLVITLAFILQRRSARKGRIALR